MKKWTLTSFLGLAISACGEGPASTDSNGSAPALDPLVACEPWFGVDGGSFEDGMRGNVAAIDCWIANAERRRAERLVEPDLIDFGRLRDGYMRSHWSGEIYPPALEAATRMPRIEVASQVALHRWSIRFFHNPDEPPLTGEPCWELDDTQIAFVRAAIPDEESAPCLEGWGIAE